MGTVEGSVITFYGYARYKISKKLKTRAIKYLEGRMFSNTRILGETLDITPQKAAAIFQRIKWIRHSQSNNKTIYRNPEFPLL